MCAWSRSIGLSVFVLHPMTMLGNDPVWFKSARLYPEIWLNGVKTQWMLSMRRIWGEPPACGEVTGGRRRKPASLGTPHQLLHDLFRAWYFLESIYFLLFGGIAPPADDYEIAWRVEVRGNCAGGLHSVCMNKLTSLCKDLAIPKQYHMSVANLSRYGAVQSHQGPGTVCI